MKKILIIGSLPPPIGGVTMHVKRLLQSLNNFEYPYCFVDLKKDSYLKASLSVVKSKWIHLHTSNVYLRFFFTLTCLLLRKKVIITVHGNLGRFKKFKNFLDNLSVKLAYVPIVINKQSLELAIRLNTNSILITAFIPPVKEEILKREIVEKIIKIRSSSEVIFCTNAYNVTYDKNGQEIYQITLLIKIFNKLPNRALVISDPSGAYIKYVIKEKLEVTNNIIFIDEPHSFFEVLKLSDVFLRITTTDGDSLSVKEAIFLAKNVIATDVVDRPEGVFVVENNINTIKSAIEEFSPSNNTIYDIGNGADALIKLYLDKVAG